MSEDRSYPPKLQFDKNVAQVTQGKQATLLPDGEWHEIVMSFDSGKELIGKYGPYYLYGVTYNGVDHSIFCNKNLHDQFVAHQAQRGATVKIKCEREDFVAKDGQTRSAAKYELQVTPSVMQVAEDNFIQSQTSAEIIDTVYGPEAPQDKPPQSDQINLLEGDL